MRRFCFCFVALFLSFSFSQTCLGATLSFNKATAEEIVAVSEGIVDADLAKAIVEHREKNGAFKDPEDLRAVPGMTTLIFNSLEPELENGDVIYSSEIDTGMKAY